MHKYSRQKTYITSIDKKFVRCIRTFKVLYFCTYFLLDICLVKEVNVGLGREKGRWILPEIVRVAISNCRDEHIVHLWKKKFFLKKIKCHEADWCFNVRKSYLLYDRFHLMRQSLLLRSKLPPDLCTRLDHSMLGLIVVRLNRFEVDHIPVHLWQNLHRLYFGWEHHTNRCFSSVLPIIISRNALTCLSSKH